MSTKIYEAYKVRATLLNELIDEVRPQVFKATMGYVKQLLASVMQDDIDKEFNKMFDYGRGITAGCEESAKMKIAWDKFVEPQCVRASNTSLRDPFDIESGLNVWLRRSYAYIIPINLDMWKVKFPPFASDYSYWNNTDQPEHISNKQWGTRSKVWDEINCGSLVGSQHNDRRLYHSFVSVTNGRVSFEFYWYLQQYYLDTLRDEKKIKEFRDKEEVRKKRKEIFEKSGV